MHIVKHIPVKLFENGAENGQGVNEAVGKAKHLTAVSLYNILPLNQLRNIKLSCTHHTQTTAV